MPTKNKPQTEVKRTRGRPRSAPTTEFGRWFIELSKKGKISTEDLEAAIRCRRTYANDLIQGKKIPSLENAIKLVNMSRNKKLTVVKPEWFFAD